MSDNYLDRLTTTALAPGAEIETRLPDLRTERLSKNIKVRPETKTELTSLGARLGIGAGGVAARILEELAAQGMLYQTWRAHCNRRRKALYRLRYPQKQPNNPCGCGAMCEDVGPECRYLHKGEAK